MKIQKSIFILLILLLLPITTILPISSYILIDNQTDEDVILKSSTISNFIYNNKDNFTNGFMENLTINNKGELILVKNNTWSQKSPLSRPSARSRHSMVYDSTHNITILVGGMDSDGYSAETWIYNHSSNTWIQMNPSYTSFQIPAIRSHEMVYDPIHDVVILFGGYAYNLGARGDTFIYNFTADVWTYIDISPSARPSQRSDPSMVYDSTHNIVILFGGNPILDDTWIYNYSNNKWTDMNPSTKPSGRSRHSMVYDPVNDVVILFGGSDQVGLDDETWIYNYTANTWTMLNPSTKPSPRNHHSMTYDSNHDLIILFGGGVGDYQETWIYNYTANTWTMEYPSNKPIGGYAPYMIYNPVYDEVVLFGGNDNSGELYNETWTYSLSFEAHHSGNYTSEIINLNSIYKINGTIDWNPINQPINTSIYFRVGISNISIDSGFSYSPWNTSSFIFNGIGRYLKYQIFFNSDPSLNNSPRINEVNLSYLGISLLQFKQIPGNLTYIYGSIGNILEWNVTDDKINNPTYTIYVDGIPLAGEINNPWISGVNISVNVDGLSQGEHNITIVVSDGLGEVIQDKVRVIVDNFSPIFANIPEDINYLFGSTGNILEWNVTDDEINNPTYTIYVDGIPLADEINNPWISGVSISVNVDGLSQGEHNITIVVSDGLGEVVQDEVRVIIDSGQSNNGIPSNNGISSYPLMIFIVISVITVIFLYRKKRDYFNYKR